jgi:hypothetical protein
MSADIPAEMPKLEPRGRGYLRAVRIAALVLGLGFLAWMLFAVVRDPKIALTRVSGTGFLAALATGLAANAVVGVLFCDLVGKLSPAIPVRRRLAAYYFSQLAKYIPGRVAALLVQSSTLDAPRSMTVTIITSIELLAIAAWTCTIAALACATRPISIALTVGIGVLGTLTSAWIIRIDWRPILRLAWRAIGRTPVQEDSMAVSRRPSFFRSITLGALSILLPSASMFVLVAYGLRYGSDEGLNLTAALLLSWVGGSLAVVFPAGIGIREFLFIGIGHAVAAVPAGEMVAIALFSRLVQVLVDLVGTAGFAAWNFLSHRAYARASTT